MPSHGPTPSPPYSVTPPGSGRPTSTASPRPTTRRPTGARDDPFLAQSNGIALTERDRQEGYDVDLLHAQPRGSITTSVAGAGAATAAGTATGAGAGEKSLHHSRPQSDYRSSNSYGAGYAGAAGVGGLAGLAAGHAAPNGKEALSSSHRESNENDPTGVAAADRPKKKWYLRPLAIGIIIGIIVAVALAIGLGVGLSQSSSSNSNSSSDSASSPAAADDNPTDASGAISSATRSRTRTSGTGTDADSTTTRETGTVVPSSLYSSYIETASPSPADASATISLNGATNRASTGNLPIPVDSATTIGGQVVSSLPDTSTPIASPSTTGARRMARQRRHIEQETWEWARDWELDQVRLLREGGRAWAKEGSEAFGQLQEPRITAPPMASASGRNPKLTQAVDAPVQQRPPARPGTSTDHSSRK